jgi:SAM-dependent methyltransferase
MIAGHLPLHLGAADFQVLLERLGPSLALWRAAEIAALRRETYEPPILDLGCGDGIVASFVLPKIDIGVDPCPHAIRRAATSTVYRTLVSRPIEQVAMAPHSVGTIISNSVLEHVVDIGVVLRAAARLLRPGGQLIFTTPSAAFTHWLALPMPAYGAWRNRHYQHHNLWTPERWQHQLDTAGLSVVKSFSYLRRGLVTAWDALELCQRVHIGRRRLFGLGWRRLSPASLQRLAHRAAALDLSAPPPGGGQLIVARKR